MPRLDVLVTIEDDTGALQSHVARVLLRSRVAAPATVVHSYTDVHTYACSHVDTHIYMHVYMQVVHKTMSDAGPSFRTLPSCLEHFGFTAQAIEALVNYAVETKVT